MLHAEFPDTRTLSWIQRAKGQLLKLEKFRIINCFGFDDSGEIEISTPGNLLYLLGRNSSGKTSVLTALSSFEYGKVPQTYARYANFEGTRKAPRLRAKFVLDANDTHQNMMSGFLDQIMQGFGSAGLQMTASEDGLQVTSGGQHFPKVSTLINGISEIYIDLVQLIVNQGTVWVEKSADGTYALSLNPGERNEYNERQEAMERLRDAAFPQRPIITVQGVNRTVSLEPLAIEGYLFKRFPETFLFTEYFSLDDDLPRALDQNQLRRPENALTEALISVLGGRTVRDLLEAKRTTTVGSLETELNGKLAKLNSQVNWDVTAGAEDADFITLAVRKSEGVELLVTVDGGESYYDQVSENTKFLIAYHLFQADRQHKNSLSAVLLFDEPNRGFHPSAEGMMLQFLESLAADNQVVIAAHSQHLIDLEHLSGVRVMGKSEQKYLSVHNTLHGASGASQDTLALQPITDAIGLKYANHIVANSEVVIVEGYTELIYLRAFARLLAHDPPNLAPVTGDGKIRTLASFLISQGVAFKVLVDEAQRRTELMTALPISKHSCFVVEEHLSLASAKTVGIEDLFTKGDFRKLLSKAGHPTNDKQFNAVTVTNSEYAKSHGIKRLVAETANTTDVLDKGNLDKDTKGNFQTVLEFCANDKWFQA